MANLTASNFVVDQRAGSRLDHTLDWSGLMAAGDTLAASTWSGPAGWTLTPIAPSGAVTGVWVDVPAGTAEGYYEVSNTVTTTAGRRDAQVCVVHVVASASPGASGSGSALFPSKVAALAALRRDRLMLLAAGSLGDAAKVSDDYLWGKLLAAESEISHTLRVPLQLTAFFPEDPTPAEITDLNGMPWAIDPGYDYTPGDFAFNDRWGMIKLRNKPLKSVSRVRFAYPGGPTAHYDLPLDWVRPDRKMGLIQFVPSSTAFAAPLNAFVMQAIGNGRTIPLAMQISYLAGIEDAAKTYPELVDVVQKTAVLKVIEDAFMPQSGSISADGLSQSLSVDMDKYHDAVDRILNGGKGSNGGLMTAIHGIRVGVV